MRARTKRPDDDVQLDTAAVRKRYNKSWVTLTRWMSRDVNPFPPPDGYHGRCPFYWRSTLDAFDERTPTTMPGPAVKRRAAQEAA